MSKVVRSVKNVTKGYSSVQVKVRNGKSVDLIGVDVLSDVSFSNEQRPMGTYRY